MLSPLEIKEALAKKDYTQIGIENKAIAMFSKAMKINKKQIWAVYSELFGDNSSGSLLQTYWQVFSYKYLRGFPDFCTIELVGVEVKCEVVQPSVVLILLDYMLCIGERLPMVMYQKELDTPLTVFMPLKAVLQYRIAEVEGEYE